MALYLGLNVAKMEMNPRCLFEKDLGIDCKRLFSHPICQCYRRFHGVAAESCGNVGEFP